MCDYLCNLNISEEGHQIFMDQSCPNLSFTKLCYSILKLSNYQS